MGFANNHCRNFVSSEVEQNYYNFLILRDNFKNANYDFLTFARVFYVLPRRKWTLSLISAKFLFLFVLKWHCI